MGITSRKDAQINEYPVLLLVSEYSQMTFQSPLNPIVVVAKFTLRF